MQIRKIIDEAIRKDGVVGDVHAVVAAQVGEQGSQRVTSRSQTRIVQRRGRTVSAETTQDATQEDTTMTESQGLTPEELDAEAGEELPDREAMSLIDANVAAPVNVAAALNVLSEGSVAYADADQTAIIDQSN